ncbi:hypothetical protein [Paludisphaera rhizosphaerae]|uniref:hypothetical protein n=1 Tax=Paludisphaera rhizosphaerae TaxID=2711216 RepID=UPI0013EB01AF|nr:hypothetical protein [Paludisphaera rhizosphaerae]
MVLTAAAGLTFAAWPLMDRMILTSRELSGLPPEWPSRFVLTFYCWCPFLAIARLMGPRERRRQAARSYGTAAVAAGTAALGFALILSLAQLLLPKYGIYTAFLLESAASKSLAIDPEYCELVDGLARSGPAATCAILGAWSTLALTGVGRRPAGWLDWFCLTSSILLVLCVAFHDLATCLI